LPLYFFIDYSVGFLRFILRAYDPRAIVLRSRVVVKAVPIINVDGVSWGYGRTDIIGFFYIFFYLVKIDFSFFFQTLHLRRE
jgi:hypothetical protein